ncbi:glutamyl-tRNA reductase [Sporolactobacillus sp. STCC-11]|uniref:glutamyl-tRNA reductase n=1 Tax=Sporolactobacillus caesalpiniae TaxID=3230362 RepID=UPI0033962834
MYLRAIGVNHRSAPVAIRERLAFTSRDLNRALSQLKQKNICEAVILSTCNRTELYLVTNHVKAGVEQASYFLARWFTMDTSELSDYLFTLEDKEAAAHLFHVACGLDSMILGETQILGQVRAAFLTAQEAGSTGRILNELFRDALNVAKRAHTETQINDHSVSVSYAAVELMKNQMHDLDQKSIVLVGAGETGSLTLKHLISNGASHITIANRTLANGQRLANSVGYGSTAIPLDRLPQAAATADIVISTASASHYLISKDDLFCQEKRRRMFVDLAMPRSMDPTLDEVDGLRLFDLDDLKIVLGDHLEARKGAAAQIEPMIDDELRNFLEWLQTLPVIPAISALRRKVIMIHEQTMRSMENKLPSISEQEREIISTHVRSMLNQFLREPIKQVRQLAAHDRAVEAAHLLTELFNLDHVQPNEMLVDQASDVPKKKIRSKSRCD